jgi:hypothetical protein
MLRGAEVGVRLIVNPALSIITLLLVLGGVSVVGVALHQPAWIIGGFLAVVVAWVFAEGTYRQWHDADAERASLARAVEDENSVEGAIVRLEGFAHETALLKREIAKGDGPRSNTRYYVMQQDWLEALNHVTARAASEIRLHAPGFLDYWQHNPDDLPPQEQQWVDFATTIADWQIEQLDFIVSRLRGGHDSPE